jgi:hypothetical protein
MKHRIMKTNNQTEPNQGPVISVFMFLCFMIL